jgi:class 3 adenylate cyclase
VAKLIVLNGVAAGTVFVLGDVPAVVGRSPEAHLRIGDPWISSMHAMFEWRDEDLWVVDLESRNGVFVADEQVAEALVPDGASVRLGRTEIRYAAIQAAPAAVPPRAEDGPRPVGRRETSRPDVPTPVARTTARGRPPADDELARRPATVLRMSIDDAGLEPGAGSAGLLRAAVERISGLALERGAAVARLAGVGVLAVFGLGGPTPDDAPDALATARDARRALRESGALELRAGVESGPVLAVRGRAGAGDLAVLGPAAERAERLAALARPGEILAGPGASEAEGLRRVGIVRLADLELEVFRLEEAT